MIKMATPGIEPGFNPRQGFVLPLNDAALKKLN